ncbi:MAG: RNA polymerase sigma factor [Opitutaceae bacterium]|jgi:RNA polymerase sigma-70 factor, ECF subfamily|nr:RNA polymerase sigma factor [Opitutaceae bacterium]
MRSFPVTPDHDVTDIDLMRALQEGSEAALCELIARWEKRLLSFVYRYTQDTHTTQDIVQETFVRLHLKREQFKPDRGFSPWLFTIAANLCHNRARWQRRHPEQSWDDTSGTTVESPTNLLADPTDGPVETTIRREQIEELKSLVLALPHDLKTAVLLHHYEGLSSAEIAQVVGCSLRGVETRIYRGLKKIRAASRFA